MHDTVIDDRWALKIKLLNPTSFSDVEHVAPFSRCCRGMRRGARLDSLPAYPPSSRTPRCILAAAVIVYVWLSLEKTDGCQIPCGVLYISSVARLQRVGHGCGLNVFLYMRALLLPSPQADPLHAQHRQRAERRQDSPGEKVLEGINVHTGAKGPCGPLAAHAPQALYHVRKM